MRGKRLALSLNYHVNRRGAPVCKTDVIHAGMRNDGEVWSFFDWVQVGLSGAAATRTFHRVFVSREALLLATVKIIGKREARLLASFDEAISKMSSVRSDFFTASGPS